MTKDPTFQLVPASTAVDAGTLRRLAVALAIAGAELALAWGLALPSVGVGESIPDGSIGITLVESFDIASAAGYHTLSASGEPSGFVLANRSTPPYVWQRAVSHEFFETMVDPRCNEWAQDAVGRLWALEVCDPVQDDWYAIDLDDGGEPITISNWCMPAWFTDPVPGHRIDRMGLLTAPWTLRPGGYAATITHGVVTPMPGPQTRSATARWSRRIDPTRWQS